MQYMPITQSFKYKIKPTLVNLAISKQNISTLFKGNKEVKTVHLAFFPFKNIVQN